MEKSAVPLEVLWTYTFLNFVHDHTLIIASKLVPKSRAPRGGMLYHTYTCK